jgi:hypothetical protein
MKKIALIVTLAIMAFACSNSTKNQTTTEQEVKEAVVLSIDDLYEKASELSDKEVVVTGTVMHVCQHGGQRCFLMGSNEDITIRVEAGEKIGAFSQEQMGSDLVITGILKEVKTEADAHNPGQEHGNEDDHEHDAQADEAHQIIAQNQEAAETVYFIEGLKVKEL